jgi:hypothetical protein
VVIGLSSLNVYRSEKCLQRKLNILFPLSHVEFDIIKRQRANVPELLVVTHICVPVIHTYMNTPLLQFWFFKRPPHIHSNDRPPLEACNAARLAARNGTTFIRAFKAVL